LLVPAALPAQQTITGQASFKLTYSGNSAQNSANPDLQIFKDVSTAALRSHHENKGKKLKKH